MKKYAKNKVQENLKKEIIHVKEVIDKSAKDDRNQLSKIIAEYEIIKQSSNENQAKLIQKQTHLEIEVNEINEVLSTEY